MAIALEGKHAGFELELREGHIAWITFNQPKRLNGFSAAMKADLAEAFVRMQLEPEVRVVVITGEGGAFCAGDDFKDYWSDESWQDARTARVERGAHDAVSLYGRLRVLSQRLNVAVRDFDKLTIAAINGHCIQSGLSLALALDFRIASNAAKLGSATLRFGYMPDEGGHHLLVQHIGVAKTMEFLLRKRIVGAADALALGLVNEVVEPEELQSRALDLAREFATGPQAAMRLLKRAIYNAGDLTFAQAADDIASKTAISDFLPDTEEGVRAFREKRPPRFNQE